MCVWWPRACPVRWGRRHTKTHACWKARAAPACRGALRAEVEARLRCGSPDCDSSFLPTYRVCAPFHLQSVYIPGYRCQASCLAGGLAGGTWPPMPSPPPPVVSVIRGRQRGRGQHWLARCWMGTVPPWRPEHKRHPSAAHTSVMAGRQVALHASGVNMHQCKASLDHDCRKADGRYIRTERGEIQRSVRVLRWDITLGSDGMHTQ